MSTTTNSIFIPEEWVLTGLEEMERQIVFLDLVQRFSQATPGELGDTIVIPHLNDLQAGTRSEDQAMYFQPTSSSGKRLRIENYAYSAFYLTDREVQMASENIDLRQAFMQKAVRAVVRQIENEMAGIYAKAGASYGTAGQALTPTLFLDIMEALDEAEIDPDGRIFIIGSKAKKEYIQMVTQEGIASNLTRTHPDAGSAAARAALVDVYGFTPFHTTAVVKTGSSPVAVHNLLLHRDAMIFGTMPLIVPEQSLGVDAASQTANNLSLRIIRSFEHDRTRYKFSVECAYGFDVIKPEALVEVLN